MNSLSFQLSDQLESPPKHSEEAEHLLRGIQAWCVARDENYDSTQDEDRSGKLDD